MDTLAAFSLGTEPPLPNIVSGEPYKEQKVLQPQIWRQIIGMSVWNFLVLMCIILFLPITSAGYAYDMTDSSRKLGEKATAGDKAKQRTISVVFNVFVFLQLFN